jgi:hypothetical protein
LTPWQSAIEIVRQELDDFLAGHLGPFSRTQAGPERISH